MLILLLLCLSVANSGQYNDHKDPNKCCVGGMVESDCQSLINASVAQKYISFFKTIKEYEEDYDVPYRNFPKTVVVESNMKRVKNLTMKAPVFQEPALYVKRFFLRHTENDMDKNFKVFVRNAVVIGTDIYRLKFHSLMVFKFEILVGKPLGTVFMDTKKVSYYNVSVKFVISCYNAATTHYFTRNYELASKVVDDGMDYIANTLMKNHKNEAEPMKEISVWSILYYTLKRDLIMQNNEDNESDKIIVELDYKISFEEKNLIGLIGEGKYPSPYILMFRKYFLDENLTESEKEKLINVAKNGLLTYDKENNKLHMFSSYYELVMSSINSNKTEAFKLLMKAIYNPVKSTEDRLLNYKANEKAKGYVKDCMNEDGLIKQSVNDLCDELYDHMNNSNIELKEYTYMENFLTKYIAEITYPNIIDNLRKNIESGEDINENILHTIFTEAINMDFEIREKNLKTVQIGIDILMEYVSREQNSPKNKLVAYKWLAEFNAVFCTKISQKTIVYESNVLQYLEKAINLLKTDILNFDLDNIDKHLQYLITKFNFAAELLVQPWEKGIERLDGWVISNSIKLPILKNETEKHVEKHVKEDSEEDSEEDMEDDMEEDVVIYNEEDCNTLFYSFLTLNHPFIHKLDVLINYYRCHMKEDNSLYFSDNIMLDFLRSALSIPVISAQDRYKNNEAHELFSVHLIKYNVIPVKLKPTFQERKDFHF